jgi:protein-disulfide isomerase
MGSNINWIDERNPFKKEKDYIDSGNTNKSWKTIINVFDDVKCDACTRRIKKGQKVLIHSETSLKMHVPKECKLW